jgi:hypothetical protein
MIVRILSLITLLIVSNAISMANARTGVVRVAEGVAAEGDRRQSCGVPAHAFAAGAM